MSRLAGQLIKKSNRDEWNYVLGGRTSLTVVPTCLTLQKRDKSTKKQLFLEGREGGTFECYYFLSYFVMCYGVKKRSVKRKKKAKTNQLIFAICTSQQQIVKSVATFFLAHPDFYEWILPCAVIYSFDVSKIKKRKKSSCCRTQPLIHQYYFIYLILSNWKHDVLEKKIKGRFGISAKTFILKSLLASLKNNCKNVLSSLTKSSNSDSVLLFWRPDF